MSRFAKSMVLIALTACLAFASAGVGSVRPGDPGDSRPGRAPAADAAPASSCCRPASRPCGSLGRPSIWRHRIKTHIEPKDGLGFRPVDLGPAEAPGDADVQMRCERSPLIPLGLFHLRC